MPLSRVQLRLLVTCCPLRSWSKLHIQCIVLSMHSPGWHAAGDAAYSRGKRDLEAQPAVSMQASDVAGARCSLLDSTTHDKICVR